MKRIRNSKKDRCRGTGQRKALFLGLLIFVTSFVTSCGGSSVTKTSADSSAVMEETAAAQAMPAAKGRGSAPFGRRGSKDSKRRRIRTGRRNPGSRSRRA